VLSTWLHVIAAALRIAMQPASGSGVLAPRRTQHSYACSQTGDAATLAGFKMAFALIANRMARKITTPAMMPTTPIVSAVAPQRTLLRPAGGTTGATWGADIGTAVGSRFGAGAGID
jgi:hypothetical protein